MSIETGNGPLSQSELSIDELTMPFDKKDQQLWFESVIGFQQEEVKRGIAPGMISFAEHIEMFEMWKEEVFYYYWQRYHARRGSF